MIKSGFVVESVVSKMWITFIHNIILNNNLNSVCLFEGPFNVTQK